MAFDSLSEKLQNVFKNLRGKGRLTEADVKAALKEVKLALLEADVEEERRLCYVGITRAKEQLFLTSAIARMLYGRTEYTRESVFLKEIDRELFDEESDRFGYRSYQEEGSGAAAQEEFSSKVRKPQYGKSARPFDQLKYIRQNTETIRKAAAASKEDLQDGDRVSHPKFGEGMVISIKGNIISIAFDSAGIKKLAMDVAPLTKLK